MTGEAQVPSVEDLAMCAHDLRGALTVIAGYTALLQRDDLTEFDRAEAVAGIEAAIGRADAILTDTVSRRKGHSKRPDELVDLAPLAHQAASDTRAAFGREVLVEAGGRVAVTGDAQGLMRLLENMLSNAAKYAPGGPIELSVLSDGDHAVIQVADRGPGIPPEARESVLEPFSRLPRDIDTPGSGLGLTVVDSVARKHRGSVSIANREGGGTVISVTLPV